MLEFLLGDSDQRSRATVPSIEATPTLTAMARLAHDLGAVVHVVVPRQAGAIANARVVADHAGVGVKVDVMARTVRARFDGSRLSRTYN